MRTLIIAAVVLGLLLVGTLANAESPRQTSALAASPVATIVNYLTTISAKEAAAPQRVCCQISGPFGNLFLLLNESHCLAVPGMPSDDGLCRN